MQLEQAGLPNNTPSGYLIVRASVSLRKQEQNSELLAREWERNGEISMSKDKESRSAKLPSTMLVVAARVAAAAAAGDVTE